MKGATSMINLTGISVSDLAALALTFAAIIALGRLKKYLIRIAESQDNNRINPQGA